MVFFFIPRLKTKYLNKHHTSKSNLFIYTLKVQWAYLKFLQNIQKIIVKLCRNNTFDVRTSMIVLQRS